MFENNRDEQLRKQKAEIERQKKILEERNRAIAEKERQKRELERRLQEQRVRQQGKRREEWNTYVWYSHQHGGQSKRLKYQYVAIEI